MNTNCDCSDFPFSPWDDSIVSATTQTMVESGPVHLVTDVTYLNSTETTIQEAALPDGTRTGMVHRFFIPKARIDANDSATWSIEGSFVGFESLTLNTLASEAVVEFDGSGWHLIGGSAIKEPQF